MSQLRMEKDDLNNVPAIPVPEGYILRNYEDGDEVGIAVIYGASDLGANTPDAVRERILQHPCFAPERVFVMEHAGELVGTSCAWLEPSDPGVGYLHMVGVLPGLRGRRLGAILTIAAIHYTQQEGFSVQRLLTDDFREPAIRLYLDLGYYPLISDETHPKRWEELATRFGRPEILARARTLPTA
ncbi:MAG: GNAT family N-acetyltransferase [Candidatus Hydrogenedentes bacterium]|nr:GNAT family N-acetyltransferase [Candidatus Hydrogenedentota bacterium]